MCLDISKKVMVKAQQVRISLGWQMIRVCAAGHICCSFPHGYNRGEPIAASHPDRVVADFADFCTALAL